MSQSVMNCAFVSTNDENLRIKSPLGQEILCENQESKHTFEDKFVETKVFKSDGNFFDAESFSKLEKYSNSFSSSEFTFNSEADLQINVDDASDDLFIERNHQKDVVLTNYIKPPFSFIDSFDIQIAKCEDSVMRHESFQFNVNLSRVNVLKNFLLSPFCKKLRWESNRFDIHNIVIVAKYNGGIAPQLIDIDSIQQCMIVKKCESHKSICIKLKMRGGDCYFINFKSEYERRQWITILKLRKDIIDYTYKLKNTQNRKEFIHLLENFVATCILFSKRKNETIQPYSELISNILDVRESMTDQIGYNTIILSISPLLEIYRPTNKWCRFFTKCFIRDKPTNRVYTILKLSIYQILKLNTDFGLNNDMRVFLHTYLMSLKYHTVYIHKEMEYFIKNLHGINAECPHPRIFNNLMTKCLSAIEILYEERKNCIMLKIDDNNSNKIIEPENENKLLIYMTIINNLVEYDDWKLQLSAVLQPIPFPIVACTHCLFLRKLSPIVIEIASDVHCSIHQTILPIRKNKKCLLDLYEKYEEMDKDRFENTEIFIHLIGKLLTCCYHRKIPFKSLLCYKDTCIYRAKMGCKIAIDYIGLLLKHNMVDAHNRLLLINVLKTSPNGKKLHSKICSQQMFIWRMQSLDTPKYITFSPNSSNEDLINFVNTGRYANVEVLSLAFTNITSEAAYYITKFKKLKVLDLWSTKFDDTGLKIIAETLTSLVVLNLCETSITDKGIKHITELKNLKILNLNSTGLTALMHNILLKKLSGLIECDVRYTEAW